MKLVFGVNKRLSIIAKLRLNASGCKIFNDSWLKDVKYLVEHDGEYL